jgi:hypothetical protein
MSNPSLGSWLKQGFVRLRAKRETQESHHMLLGVQKSVKESTLTLIGELSSWKLESQMDFRIFKERLQGTKFNELRRSLYH